MVPVLVSKIIGTPLGSLIAAASKDGICLFDYTDRLRYDAVIGRVEKEQGASLQLGEHALLSELEKQVADYFAGRRQQFDLPFIFSGTPFQQKVWHALMEIPFGEIHTYKKLSLTLGDEKAIRAVAKAVGENALAVVCPCHRIVGSGGELTGYSGGIDRKKWLLDHEAKISTGIVQTSLFV